MDNRMCSDFIRALVLTEAGATTLAALAPAWKPESGSAAPLDIVVKDLSDGNMCRVFQVINQVGGAGSVIVKQALPFVRCAPTVRVPQSRIEVEKALLEAHSALCPGKMPRIHHYDATMGALIMEALDPHVVLRADLMLANLYPLLAADASTYMARTLFYSSVWARADKQPAAVQAAIAALEAGGNNAPCKDITAEVFFQTPYDPASDPPVGPSATASAAGPAIRFPNKWSRGVPAVEAGMRSLRTHPGVKAAVARLSERFYSVRQALLHGDLHTGSCMTAVTIEGLRQRTFETLRPEDYEPTDGSMPRAVGDFRVIDGEFSCLGPIGFDVGTLMANLLLALLYSNAQVRKAAAAVAKGGYAKYTAEKTRERWAMHSSALAETISDTWSRFVARFVGEWEADATGAAVPTGVTAAHGGCGGSGCCTEETGGGSGDACCKEGSSGACCDDGAACCAAPATAAAAAAPVDAARTQQQLQVLTSILEDTIGYAATELVRRTVGVARVAEVERLDSPAARAGVEARVLAIAQHLLLTAPALAARTGRAAAAALDSSVGDGGRSGALEVVMAAVDPLVTAVLGIDGEPSWSAVDAPATVATAAGRPAEATLVLVAKNPLPASEGGATSVKSRLSAAAASGSAGGSAAGLSPEAARAFHGACIKDLLQRFGNGAGAALHSLRRVWLYAPGGDAAAAAALGGWLKTATASGTGTDAGAEAWALQPAATAGATDGSDLTSVLSDALATSLRRIWGPVVFIGADCPTLSTSEVTAALAHATTGRAYIVPAADGGYALLGLPAHAAVSLGGDAATSAGVSPLFDGVSWSAPATFASQMQRLAAAGIETVVAPTTYRDIDDAADYAWLQQAASSGRVVVDGHTVAEACPAVAAALAAQ